MVILIHVLTQIRCVENDSCKFFKLEKFVADVAMMFSDCDSCSKFALCWKKKFIPCVNLINGKYKRHSIGVASPLVRHSQSTIETTGRNHTAIETTPKSGRLHSSESSTEITPQGKKCSSESMTPTSSKRKRGSLLFTNSMNDTDDLDKHIQQHHIGKLPLKKYLCINCMSERLKKP